MSRSCRQPISACLTFTNHANQKSNPEGQRARKIDDADGPVAIVKNNTDLANAVQLGMRKRKINASQLALKIYEKPDVIRKILNKDAAKPSTNILVKMEKELGVKLLGKDNLGEPTEKGKKMDEEDEAARKAEEAKEAKQAKEAEEAKEGEEAEETAAKSEIAETQEA